MKTLIKLFFALLIANCTLTIAKAQNIAITDDDGYSANSSAILDVKSVSKGMLVPRLRTVERDAVVNPATGLLVFDTDAGSFYFYNGTSWINLTSGSASGILGYTAPDKVYLTDANDKLGVGTIAPNNKLDIRADATNKLDQAIFNVVNNDGDTVFAVYPQGVRINVADESSARASSTKGGFAVGGFSPGRGATTGEYLRVTPDSIRMNIEEGDLSRAESTKGGFAVGGYSPGRANVKNYFNIYGSNTVDSIYPSEARIFWYPLKEAFLAGRVIAQGPDSVGTNSFSSGNESKAIGDYSQAFGNQARAFGNNSTAIGNFANANADNSFAFGDSAIAMGKGSYAIGSVGRDTTGISTGIPTMAYGDYSFSIGLGTRADSTNAFAFGNNTQAKGVSSTAFGYESIANGRYAIAGGYKSEAWERSSIALGEDALAYKRGVALGTSAYAGESSVVLGSYSFTGSNSISIGTGNMCNTNAAILIGSDNDFDNNASGSVVIGDGNVASYPYSYAFGNSNHFYNDFPGLYDVSMALGYNNTINRLGAFAIGHNLISSGEYSFAIGCDNTASGNYSTSIGRGITTSGQYSIGIALDNLSSTTLAQANTMAIMGGNVGINTVTPSYRLDVNGDIRATGAVYANANNISGMYFKGGDDSEIWDVGSANTLAICGTWDNSIATLRLGSGSGGVSEISGSAGNIGIGTTAPAYKLDVAGAVNLMSGYGTAIALRANGVEALWSNGTYFSWGYGGTYNYFEDELGLGVTSPTYRLTLPNSTVNLIGKGIANAWVTYSDSRVKKEQENIKYGLEDIMKMQPKQYQHYDSEFIDGRLKLGENHNLSLGLIAQELYQIIPEVVFKPEDEAKELWSIDYEKLTPVLIQAIKDQQNQIEVLIRKNDTLKAEMDIKSANEIKQNIQLNDMQKQINQMQNMLNIKAENNE
ncbi:MAG TPA: hypothetical protein DDX39_00190 [Bacteroidales bacterium]|nr:hypothetical protein [Bacteroidales bacterium]